MFLQAKQLSQNNKEQSVTVLELLEFLLLLELLCPSAELLDNPNHADKIQRILDKSSCRGRKQTPGKSLRPFRDLPPQNQIHQKCTYLYN